ncbi:MAG: SPASM domain-containing protein [Deltaproteobacteria bacterium]|nr:SPASM domain-containing protein [Deltaproteobacteria bacterium]
MDYSVPIRVRWDVDFRGRAGRTKRIARQISEATPLAVELRIEGKRGLSEFPAIYTEIHKCNPRIEATVRLFPEAASVARRGYSVDFVWEVGHRELFRRVLPPGADAISFTSDEGSLAHLPDVLEEFAESEARALHLPNVNAIRALAEVGYVPIPRPGQLKEAAERISLLGVSLEGKKLVVHDYFLWKLLRAVFPNETGDRVEFSGCQAASALAHVDWDGNVYPCDSLPIRLGNLQETTFEKIWRSPARQQVLSAIRSLPPSCEPCDQLEECRSGCRGLACLASGRMSEPDPSCVPPPGPTGSSSET